MSKVKMKTNRSAAKRFTYNSGGKLKRNRGGGSHLNSKKSAKRKRRLNGKVYLEGSGAIRIKSYVFNV